MFYTWDVAIVIRHLNILIAGLVGTLKLTGVSLIFGVLLGLCAALIRLSNIPALRVPATEMVSIIF